MKWIGDDCGIECRLGNCELCPLLVKEITVRLNPSLPPVPPQHPEIKTDKNISSHFRTSRSLTLSSPGLSFRNTLLLLPLSAQSQLHVFFCLPLLPFYFSSFISASLLHCLSSVHTERPGRLVSKV